MDKTLYNIKCSNGNFTANLKGGTPVKGEYSISEQDEVTLESVEVFESDGSFEVSSAELDFEELEEVISMRLGNFPTTRASKYGSNDI